MTELLRKNLKDGREVVVNIVPEKEGRLSYWLEIAISGGRPSRVKDSMRPIDKPQGDLVVGLYAGYKRSIGLTADEAKRLTAGIDAWKQARREAADGERNETVRRVLAAVPDAKTWQISAGEGLGGSPFVVGQTLRHNGQVVTVLKSSCRYYREDGYSFGVGDEAGYLYLATVREATDEESAPILAAEERARRRSQLRSKALSAFGWAYRTAISPQGDAERPVSVADYSMLPRVRVGRLTELRVDEVANVVYSVTSNSTDGDDWSLSNAPGAIVYVQPLTPERARIVAELREIG